MSSNLRYTFPKDVMHVMLYAQQFTFKLGEQSFSICDTVFVAYECTPSTKALLLSGVMNVLRSRLAAYGTLTNFDGTLTIHLSAKFVAPEDPDADCFTNKDLVHTQALFKEACDYTVISVEMDTLWNSDMRSALLRRLITATLSDASDSFIDVGVDVPDLVALRPNGKHDRNPVGVAWDWRYSKLRRHLMVGTAMDATPYHTLRAPFQSLADLIIAGDKVCLSWLATTHVMVTTSTSFTFEVTQALSSKMSGEMCTLFQPFLDGSESVWVAILTRPAGLHILVCDSEDLVTQEGVAMPDRKLQSTYMWQPAQDPTYLASLLTSLPKTTAFGIRSHKPLPYDVLTTLAAEVAIPVLLCTNTSFSLQIKDTCYLYEMDQAAPRVGLADVAACLTTLPPSFKRRSTSRKPVKKAFVLPTPCSP